MSDFRTLYPLVFENQEDSPATTITVINSGSINKSKSTFNNDLYPSYYLILLSCFQSRPASPDMKHLAIRLRSEARTVDLTRCNAFQTPRQSLPMTQSHHRSRHSGVCLDGRSYFVIRATNARQSTYPIPLNRTPNTTPIVPAHALMDVIRSLIRPISSVRLS